MSVVGMPLNIIGFVFPDRRVLFGVVGMPLKISDFFFAYIQIR